MASQPVVNPGKRRVRGEMVPNKEKRAPAQSSRLPQPGAYALDLSIFLFMETVSRCLVFFLQKKHRLRFDESDDEGMISLLEAATTPPCELAEQPAVAEEGRVEPSFVWKMPGGLHLPSELLKRSQVRPWWC